MAVRGYRKSMPSAPRVVRTGSDENSAAEVLVEAVSVMA